MRLLRPADRRAGHARTLSLPMVSTESPITRPPFGPTLAALTLGKATSNAALRWMSPFLPTLSRAFDASVGTLTGIMGAAELAGLSTTLTGGTLDRGRHR